MPKVATEHIQFYHPTELRSVDVFYSKTGGLFTITLTDEEANFITDERVKQNAYHSTPTRNRSRDARYTYSAFGNTYKEAVDMYRDIYERKRKATATEEKVIKFHLAYDTSGQADERKMHAMSFSSHNDPIAIEFDYRVVWKRTIGTQVEFFEMSVEEHEAAKVEYQHASRREVHFGRNQPSLRMNEEMPWTEEREQFCEKFRARLLGLVEMVADFFGELDEHTLARIDGGGQKLLGS